MSANEGSAGENGLADLLRSLREKRSLTQEELAERAGLTVKAVGALERGERRRPYPHTVRSLADALGLDARERSALVAAVHRRGEQPTAPVGSATISPPTRSSVSAAPLLGREADTVRVEALLRDGARLVTLTGPGGVGKTRLALDLAARVSDQAGSGFVVVELADVRDAALVPGRIAAALDVPEGGRDDGISGLIPYLDGRPLLLVLDNLEQVLGCAADVATLVSRCRTLQVLATSRAPLRVRAEHEVPVRPLPVPPHNATAVTSVSEFPAVQMFLDRASATGRDLELSEQNAPLVAAICRRLDGLPLGLELAAAATRLLPPEALLERFDTVAGMPGPRDLPDRQRTMTATLDWSLDLLPASERQLFVRLGVFQGGFSLDVVEALQGGAPEVLNTLYTLVEHSLLVPEPTTGEPRFRLLEPVRQYAAAQLEASPDAVATAEQHADIFCRLARSLQGPLRGAGLVPALDRLEREHANLREAFAHLLRASRPEDAAELVHDIWLYLALRGQVREGLAWTAQLDGLAMSDAARAAGLIAAAGLHYVAGDLDEVQQLGGAALRLARNLARDDLRAEAAIMAGSGALFTGLLDTARSLLAEASVHAARADDAWGQVHTDIAVNQVLLLAGDLENAQRGLAEAEVAARRLGQAFTLATVLNVEATLTELRGDTAASATLLAEATELSVQASLSWTLGYALPALAGVAARLGEAETAARLFGASASVASAHAVATRFPVSRVLNEEGLVRVRSQLGDAAFRSAWDAGRTADRAELAALARTIRQRARG